MKVSEWLSNLEYDSHSMTIEKIVNNSSVVVIDIRGWSTIVKSLGSENRAAVFQDSVGEFVLEAINEKLENDKTKQQIWEVIKESITQEAIDALNSIPLDILKEAAKKYLNNETNN
jgi:hypothetical protein